MNGVRVLTLVYVVALVLVAGRAARSATWNFDVVGYVAAVHSLSEKDPQRLHVATYDALERQLPQEAYRAVSDGSEYRRALRARSADLATQVPFYTNKPGYVGLLALLARAGAPVALATRAISVTAYLALGLLTLFWFKRISPGFGVTLALVFMLVPSTAAFASYSTPDMLSAFLLGSAAFVALDAKRTVLAFCLLCVACSIRPDNILFATLLVALLVWNGESVRVRVRSILAWLALSAFSLAVPALAGAHSWGVLMKHTFVSRLHDPARMSEVIAPSEYLHALARGLTASGATETTLMPLFALLTLVSLSMARRTSDRPVAIRARRVFALCWIAIACRYLAFPMLSDRFFIAFYLLLSATFVALLGAWLTRISE